MAKRVRACRLGDPGFLHSLFHRLLQDRLMKMVPASFSRHPVRVMASRRKDPLPPPLFPCVWVFALKRIGQSDSAQAALKIALVLSFYQIKMLGERFFDCCGKHRVPVLVPLASPDYDLVTAGINILDPQPKAFHQSETCSIEQHGHDPLRAVEAAKNRPDLLPCQHDREPVRPFRPDSAINVTNVLV